MGTSTSSSLPSLEVKGKANSLITGLVSLATSPHPYPCSIKRPISLQMFPGVPGALCQQCQERGWEQGPNMVLFHNKKAHLNIFIEIVFAGPANGQ